MIVHRKRSNGTEVTERKHEKAKQGAAFCQSTNHRARSSQYTSDVLRHSTYISIHPFQSCAAFQLSVPCFFFFWAMSTVRGESKELFSTSLKSLWIGQAHFPRVFCNYRLSYSTLNHFLNPMSKIISSIAPCVNYSDTRFICCASDDIEKTRLNTDVISTDK